MISLRYYHASILHPLFYHHEEYRSYVHQQPVPGRPLYMPDPAWHEDGLVHLRGNYPIPNAIRKSCMGHRSLSTHTYELAENLRSLFFLTMLEKEEPLQE